MPSQPGMLDVAIIGTGFSGLCMGIKLKQAGHDNFRLFEKADEVGGVWRANTYPGACCDVPANLYSFSFEMKTDWSRRYPPQPEIQQYMRDTAEKYGLYPHIQFNTGIASATFDDDANHWRITTDAGEILLAKTLVCGVGQLGRPAWPDIPGLRDFKGKLFHSADWDHDYDLADKRVAVIGTGASAIQFIPEIAPRVAELHVIQRTAPYVIPKPDTEYGGGHRFLFDHIPGYQKLYRGFWYLLGETSTGIFNRGSHTADLYKKITLAHMHHHVKEPVMRAKLTPDYPIGCKRVLFASNYYPALARPNVEVITDGIRGIGSDHILFDNGEKIEVDCIILGTGFKATEFLAPMQVTGRNGLDLNETWRDGAEAYLGITVSGFPNFFMLYGPNTNLGSNSIIFMIESQAHYIMQALEPLLTGKLKQIDLKADVQRDYNVRIQQQLKDSVWSAGCHSWYHNEAGKVTNNWPGNTRRYRRLTRQLKLADFLIT